MCSLWLAIFVTCSVAVLDIVGTFLFGTFLSVIVSSFFLFKFPDEVLFQVTTHSEFCFWTCLAMA